MEDNGVFRVYPFHRGQDVGYWLLQSWEYFMTEGLYNDEDYITMTDPQEY